jgi:NMD protein affecting ribosome stability and mRNA decay
MHNPSYYEAILQLRPYNDELMKFVLGQIEERKNVHIAKQVKLKTGVDIYISDQRFTQALGKKLKKRFKGKVIKSKKIHTVNRLTSKKVYRVTVCFRLDENGKYHEN